MSKFSKLTKPELEKILENANFTAEEEQIFRFRISLPLLLLVFN